MATNFLSATVAANDQATAAQYNNLRKDVVQNGGDAATSGGSANAYTLAIDAQIAAYAAFQVFKFKANFANTGPATLNVNGIGAQTIKKNGSADLIAGDIQNGQMIIVSYDGTNMQLLSGATAAANVKFGGTGADGALDTSGGTVNIDLGSAAYVEKNYTSINIVTNNLTFTNPHANGTNIVLKSQGNVVISASIVASGLGAAGGAASSAGNDSGWKFDQASTVATGATGGPIWAWTNQYTDDTNKLHKRMLIVAPGSGGAGGPTGGATGGATGGTGGPGGRGGAGLIIECGGAWNFTGTITVAAANGTNGGNATPAGGSACGGGGGGGGSGGQLLVLYNTLVANSGTVTKTGGNGGNGGNGAGSTGNPGNPPNGAGGASRNTSAGGGGGATGGQGNNGLVGSAASSGGSGGSFGTVGGNGGGGSGGGGGAVGQSLIVQNVWFA